MAHAEAEQSAALRQEQAGKGLADILVAQLEARFRYLIDRIKGAAEAEELLSEQRRQTRDLHQSFVDQKVSMIVGTIERVCAANKLTLRDGMTPIELARCIELAAHGLRSLKSRCESACSRKINSPACRRSASRGARRSGAKP